jgi:hypothetical protein
MDLASYTPSTDYVQAIVSASDCKKERYVTNSSTGSDIFRAVHSWTTKEGSDCGTAAVAFSRRASP